MIKKVTKESAKFHCKIYNKYVHCVEIIIQKMCVHVMHQARCGDVNVIH